MGVARTDREGGQAAVESALTVPMMMFALLGILQLTLAYHARIVSEYAAFKAVRAGSVFRADCAHMKSAALMALVPTMPVTSGAPAAQYLATARRALTNRARSLASNIPIVWLDYKLENTGKDFDLQLEPGSAQLLRLRVKLAYFFEYRVPFANSIMVRYWLAVQTGKAWADNDPTMPVAKANTVAAKRSVDAELANQVLINVTRQFYSSPIVTSWSMRMFSDPLSKALSARGGWKCK